MCMGRPERSCYFVLSVIFVNQFTRKLLCVDLHTVIL